MILRRFALFSLLAVFTVTGGARAVDRDKLRKAVSLPLDEVKVGFGFNDRGGFTQSTKPRPRPEEIAEIEKNLKGDVTDAERYYDLASLYSRAGQRAKAEQAGRKCITLLRKQMEERPDDNTTRILLAQALQVVEELQEAEVLLRRVVKDCPKDWHAWVELGQLLAKKSYKVVTGKAQFLGGGPDGLLQWIRAAAPTPRQIAQSRQDCKEASACFDRAIALAPGEAEVYGRRGSFRYLNVFLVTALRSYQGEKLDLEIPFLGADAWSDLRRAVELRQDDYAGIGMVAMLEVSADAYKYHLSNPSTKKTKNQQGFLSTSTRKELRADIVRLQKGMENPDKRKAAEAAEVLGILQAMGEGDCASAEKSWRRSIALDPSRWTAWEMLYGVLMSAEDYRKAVDLCRQRLENDDCPRIRLFLAKAYERLDEPGRAEAVIRVGLNHEPDDFTLNLALADLLLMQDDTFENLKMAVDILHKLDKQYQRTPLAVDEDCRANYVFAWAIVAGLAGEVKKAREFLERLQKDQPDYPDIKEALEALAAPNETVSSQPHP